MKRILVVDDEVNVAGAMHEGLRSLYDCEVCVAYGGHEAAFLMESRPFDLLITDFRMPDMDGLTLAERARELMPNVKIILLSAFLDDGVAERAQCVGITQLLSKPVRTRDLRGMAREALAMP